jgi:competence protein ComEA
MKYFSLSQQWVLLLAALLLLGSLTLKFYYSPRSPSGEPVKEVVVEVLGEVRRPGIYLFQDPPNLGQAIERAGGFKETAQFGPALSSTVLETGTLLTVTSEPYQSPPSLALSSGERSGIKQGEIRIKVGRMAVNKLLVFSIPLDLNRVSVEELCLIPGIGKSLAQEMVTYRERRRGFRSVEELKKVRGIGEKKFHDLEGFFAAP